MSLENRADGVDPSLVPAKLLATGARMPVIGMGTFGSDKFSGAVVADAIRGGAKAGYRHFDCASVYGNEADVGVALADVIGSGVRRDELWITSKVWNDSHRRVVESCEQSLRDLRLDYLDLYLVHWPFPNWHPPHCDVGSRSPDARPYAHREFMKTWEQMESLVDRGLVRHVGTSNMTIPKLTPLLSDCRIRPVANEMELHPHFQQPELFEFVRREGLIPIGFSPVGSPKRPERDTTPSDTVDIEDSVVVRIAARLGIHPATLCVKWAVQRGHVPIPFSITPRNYLANIRSVVGAPLTAQDMADLTAIDRNCRLIKGQVFLWKDDQSWEDLWDLDGRIAQ